MPFAPSVMPDAGSPPRVRGKGQSKGREQRELRITPACAGKSNTKNAIKSIGRDHPRVCGEKVRIKPRKTWEEGSPPRVRGKVLLKARAAARRGITPACAGKRIHYSIQHHCALGSPPRVRGKEKQDDDPPSASGITPACAGKSTLRKTAGSTYRDHPRVCGEKAAERAEVGKGRGSPPRVRGKGSFVHPSRAATRITPACAGKRLKKALKNKDF